MTDATPDFSVPTPNGHDSAIPEFRMQPVKNGFKSEAKGTPVYEDKEFVLIRVPGDRKTEWDGEVTDEHRARWPRHYAAWKANQEAPTEGTPLSEWAAIGRSQVEELRFANVKTVEQLAGLPDDLLTRSVSMGGFELRQRAIRHLQAVQGNAPMEALAAENAAQREKIDAMEKNQADLSARLDALLAQNAGAAR